MDKKLQEQLEQQLKDAQYAELAIEQIDGKQVFVASDETVDREGEIISLDGWQLENFKRNPILLWSHNPFEPMIGRAANIRMRNVNGRKKLTFEPEFHRKNDMSRLIADLVEEGWMKTVSVGFRPYERQGNRFTKQELLEISFVNIPANPEATTLALSKGYGKEAVTKLFGEEAVQDTEKPAEKVMEPEATETSKITEDVQETEASTPTVEERLISVEATIAKMNEEIERLGVAQAKPTEPESSPADGRSDKADKIVRLIKFANKAIDKALAEQKGAPSTSTKKLIQSADKALDLVLHSLKQ